MSSFFGPPCNDDETDGVFLLLEFSEKKLSLLRAYKLLSLAYKVLTITLNLPVLDNSIKTFFYSCWSHVLFSLLAALVHHFIINFSRTTPTSSSSLKIINRPFIHWQHSFSFTLFSVHSPCLTCSFIAIHHSFFLPLQTCNAPVQYNTIQYNAYIKVY